MKALTTAIIYFGTFVTIGLVAKLTIGRWMKQHDVDLGDVQAQAGPNRRKRKMFLLGAWRWEE